MKKDFKEENSIVQVIDPAVVTDDVNGASVDLKGYDGGVTFIANIGESGDTLSGSVYIECEVEESVDDSTFTDVADDDLSDPVDGNNDGCFGVIDSGDDDDAAYSTTYKGNKRYVRPVLNLTGTHSTGTPISVTAIKHGYKYPPL